MFFAKLCWKRLQNTRRKYWGKKFPLGLPWEILLWIPVHTHACSHKFSSELHPNFRHCLKQESVCETCAWKGRLGAGCWPGGRAGCPFAQIRSLWPQLAGKSTPASASDTQLSGCSSGRTFPPITLFNFVI